jgi:hypothetical protein
MISPGGIAGIVMFLLLLLLVAAAGVYFYRDRVWDWIRNGQW